MILSGREILRRLGSDIEIDPFEISRINPNSYNLTLHNELLTYREMPLDMRKDNPVERMVIPPEGFEMKPGILYLGRTREFTRTKNLVPMLEGRSSVGRLGLYIHVTAGFGDVGFAGYWTLELHCIHPIRIYPNVPICQIFYHQVNGEVTEYVSGKYQNNVGIQASRMFLDFGGDEVV